MSDTGTWTGVGIKPQVSSASVVLDKVLRVVFNETMLDDANLRSALSYTIVALDPGSTSVSIVSVTPNDGDTYVDLLVDKSFTNGTANYQVTVSTSLKDLAGNTLDPTADDATFDGFGPRPVVQLARAIAIREVLITFGSAMKADAALTTPGNYAFSSSTGPLVTPTLVEVVSSSIVKVTLDFNLGIGDSYVVTVSGVKDLSENLIAASPFNKATFAWTPFTAEIASLQEVLSLKKYDFLIREIREQDQKNGNQFVERFLTGGQEVWEENVSKIFSLKNLWSVEDCPDEYLQYLKAIVGWTGPVADFAKDLEPATLRRLISLSASLWKNRGSETAIVDVLNILVPSRVLFWSWFDVRWMTDETAFDEQRQGRDPWLFSMPAVDPYYPEHWSIIRMVDPGEDARATVRSVVNLMRPLGENFLIVYLLFLDLFEVDGDLSQWNVEDAPSAVVEEGYMALTDADREVVLSNAIGSDAWSNSMIYARLRGTKADSVDKGLRVDFLNNGSAGYCAYLDLYSNTLVLAETDDLNLTPLDTFDFNSIPYELQENVWYGVRIHSAWEGTDLRLRVYVGGTERINYLVDSLDVVSEEGTAGFGHEDGVSIEVSDFEVLGLPVVSETIEIG